VIVMKFGGTSVGSAERIEGVAQLVRERLPRRPIVVVSAFARVTDTLIRAARLAEARDGGHARLTAELRERHESVVRALVQEPQARERLLEYVAALTNELGTLCSAVQQLGELTARSLDAVSALGERLSYQIVATALAERGVPADAVDARELLVTDESFGRATPDFEATETRARAKLLPLVLKGCVPLLPGFVGATPSGLTSTLGRGGSDWSASIFGSVLGAEEIQIWTDVDGMMTVDPRLVASARVIPEVSFAEAAELAYFGAKVLHPATIRPAVERGIPVVVLNTLNPGAPGTRITESAAAEEGEPRAIATKKGITVVMISQPRMLLAYGFLARVFEVFNRHRTPVDLIATSEVSVSLTIDNAERLEAIRRDLAELGEVQALERMAIVSVVGRGFTKRSGLAGRLFGALAGVNIVMISFGASDVNVSFVVSEQDADAAVRALHRAFFE
jgi:aspartate kinase